MSSRRENLIFFALWGMDISWLYGWTGLIMLAGFDRVYPSWAATTITGTAAILMFFLRRHCRRIYQMVGFELLFLILIATGLVYLFEQPETTFFNPAWLAEFCHQSRTLSQWFFLIILLFSGGVFWYAGSRLPWRKPIYPTVSNHFDLGIIALIMLFLVEMMLETKGNITVAQPLLLRTLCVFFLFSVPAFCLARGSGGNRSDFLAGFRSLGVILGFLFPVLLFGGGIITLLFPYLTAAAKGGVGLLQVVTAPFGSFLVKILLFFFGHSKMSSEPAVPKPDHDQLTPMLQAPQQTEGWMLLPQKALLVLAVGLGILVVLLLLGLLLWQLVWWLSRPTDRQAQTVSPWQFVYRLLSGFFRTFFSLLSRKAKITDNRDNPAHLYLALAAWGKNSGVPLQLMETPNEYGQRLCARFPVAQRDILTIITTQNRFVYGAMIEDRLNARSSQLLQARGACRRLRSPHLWPMRMRSLLLR